MYLLTKLNFNGKNLLNLLIALFPVCFIAGNMIININLILIISLSILLFKGDLFRIKIYFLDKLILIFFVTIIFTGIINDYFFFTQKLIWKGYFSTIIKSIFFLKYLFLYIVLRFLIEKDYLDLKPFFITSSLCVLFVTLDIFYQFIYGKDIFGFTPKGRKLSGPFGDELIAGGFLQRFSLFILFLIPLFFNKISSNIVYKYIISFLFLILCLGLILSGNRMPLLIFLLSIFLITIFQKQTRKFLISFFIIFIIVFSILFKTNQLIRYNFLDFYVQISKSVQMIMDGNAFNQKAPGYLKEFSTFYDTWLMNKYLGGGIKNFRYYCHKRPNIDKNVKFVCNMHPHNYYLEILTETGLVGLFLITLIFANILYLSFIKKYFFKTAFLNNNLIIPFIFLFIAEIFPLKSTGSFFTTGNSTYLFLIIGIIIGLARRDNNIAIKN